MNTNESNIELERLCLQARESEPQLCDPQFTANVLSGIATSPAVPLAINSKPHGSWLMDVITAGLGFAAVSFFVDLQKVYAFIVHMVPESVVISPMTVFAAMIGVTTLSVASWWSIEQR